MIFNVAYSKTAAMIARLILFVFSFSGVAQLAAWPTKAADSDVIVVDIDGGGDALTIRAALAIAKAGAHIHIRPGVYQEALTIDMPITLSGDGGPGDVVIEAYGAPTIFWTAPSGKIQGVTLRQTGGDGIWFALAIGGGAPLIERTIASSETAAAIGVFGGATPTIRESEIRDTFESGIFIYEQSGGFIVNNAVSGTRFAGIEISENSTPTVRANVVFGGAEGGILVSGAGGLIEDNKIFQNAYAGLEIRNGAKPIIRRNIIRDNKEAGVLFQHGGQGTLVDNRIVRNGLAGVEIRSHALPSIRRNTICGNGGGGVNIYDGGGGELVNNALGGNIGNDFEIAQNVGDITQLNNTRANGLTSLQAFRIAPSQRYRGGCQFSAFND